jgi:serine/threonine-protein kinase
MDLLDPMDPMDLMDLYTLPAMVFRGQTLGKYRIREPIGSGGFGTVYLAEDTWIDKRVAIKVPHKQNMDFGELLREPRLLASLNHPNIVTVITAEKQDGVFFIVMEYVPGDTLETIILERGALDLPLALDYICQIANAVEHAHRQGVIHRDLRPANVFVTERGLLKVGDFGTSRFLEIAAHGTTVIGSPPYMAPEQFEGRAVFASDLYSLGVTMYQMLTGVLPYDTPAPADLERLRRGELVSSVRLKNSAIPPAIDAVVMRALSADVANRYQHAEQIVTDLLAARDLIRRPRPAVPAAAAHAGSAAAAAPLRPAARPAGGTPLRHRTRELGPSRFCWHCRKPLPARTAACPFCGEAQ